MKMMWAFVFGVKSDFYQMNYEERGRFNLVGQVGRKKQGCCSTPFAYPYVNISTIRQIFPQLARYFHNQLATYILKSKFSEDQIQVRREAPKEG